MTNFVQKEEEKERITCFFHKEALWVVPRTLSSQSIMGHLQISKGSHLKGCARVTKVTTWSEKSQSYFGHPDFTHKHKSSLKKSL